MDLRAARLAGVRAVAAAAVVTETVRASIDSSDSVGKADRSPVTVADFAAQAILILRLREAFPGVAVVAEEDADELRSPAGAVLRARVVGHVQTCPGCEGLSAEEILSAIDIGRASPPGPLGTAVATGGDGEQPPPRYFWCIDPIDGTKGFLRNDQYAICLGLVRVEADGRGTAVLGVLGCPNLPAAGDDTRGSIIHAARGLGAAMLPLPVADAEDLVERSSSLAVSQTAPADSVMVESVEPGHTDQSANAALCAAVGMTAPPVRMDSQCKYAVVARGEAGLYLRSADAHQNIWDHAAGACVVAEAGGAVTDARGAPLDFGAGRQLTRNTPTLVTSHGAALHGLVIRQIALAAAGTSRAVAAPEPALETAGRRYSGGGGGGGASFSADFGNGLTLREAQNEWDAQGAAALLEMCDVEFVFPGQKTSQWAAQVARTAAGVRSYLPPASVSGMEVIHDHGPDDDAAQRARSVFYVLVDSEGVLGTCAVHPGKGGSHQASGPDDPTVAVFARFGLSPALRGLGIGQQLYDAAEGFCLNDGGYRKMWLETSRRQKAARKVYLRNGWEVLESIDNAWEDDLLGKDLPLAMANTLAIESDDSSSSATWAGAISAGTEADAVGAVAATHKRAKH